MNIEHFEKNFHYSDKELLHVARKLGKLATYCKRLKNEDSAIRVEVENRATKKERDQIKVTIVVELPGKTLTADSRKDNVTEAIDRVVEKLEPQVKKYKDLHTGMGMAKKTGGASQRRRAA